MSSSWSFWLAVVSVVVSSHGQLAYRPYAGAGRAGGALYSSVGSRLVSQSPYVSATAGVGRAPYIPTGRTGLTGPTGVPSLYRPGRLSSYAYAPFDSRAVTSAVKQFLQHPVMSLRTAEEYEQAVTLFQRRKSTATAADLVAVAGELSSHAQLLREEAAALEESVAEVVEAAIDEEDQNGLECCTDMQSAHCASCVLGMTLRDYCSMPDTRPLPGCGFGAATGECGVGIISADGTACCDPDHCGGQCGGKGCRGLFGGPSHCCASAIRVVGESCDTHNPPCVKTSEDSPVIEF